MERRIIPVRRLRSFETEFKEKIEAINKANPRCKPLKLDIYKRDLIDDCIMIYLSGVFDMEVIPAKKNNE